MVLQTLGASWPLPDPRDDDATAMVRDVHANVRDFLRRLCTGGKDLKNAPLLAGTRRVTIPVSEMEEALRVWQQLRVDPDVVARGLRRTLPRLGLRNLGFRTAQEYEAADEPLPLDEHVRYLFACPPRIWARETRTSRGGEPLRGRWTSV